MSIKAKKHMSNFLAISR